MGPSLDRHRLVAVAFGPLVPIFGVKGVFGGAAVLVAVGVAAYGVALASG